MKEGKNPIKTLGLKKSWIYETIVTTTDGWGVNAAPIGIFSKNLKTLELKVYKGSKTYENIVTTNELVVNFTKDVSLFYEAIKKKGRKIEYKNSNFVICPKLKEAEAALELRVKKRKDADKKKAVVFECEIVYFDIGKNWVKLINRAEALFLEALIAKTKKKDLKEFKRVISKVAPKSIYEKNIKKI